MSSKSTSVLGLRVDLYSKKEILVELESAIRENTKKVFAYLNVHGANLAVREPWIKRFYDIADIVYADGQGIRFACWLLSDEIPPHLPLTEWIWDMMNICDERGYSVYLLGGTQEVVQEAVEKISRKYSRLRIAGSQDGYFQKNGVESDSVVHNVNKVSPDILLIGLGMPAQEKWVVDNLQQLQVRALFTVGGCIDVLAGRRLHVPIMIRRMGLEWALRLIEEPGRLFSRYVIGTPKFALRVLAEKFRMKRTAD